MQERDRPARLTKAWERDTAVRFVPYDCNACYECWLKSSCIYSLPPQSPEEIARCANSEREMMDWSDWRWDDDEQLEFNFSIKKTCK